MPRSTYKVSGSHRIPIQAIWPQGLGSNHFATLPQQLKWNQDFPFTSDSSLGPVEAQKPHSPLISFSNDSCEHSISVSALSTEEPLQAAQGHVKERQPGRGVWKTFSTQSGKQVNANTVTLCICRFLICRFCQSQIKIVLNY